jgi:phospholipid-binding lipoprotein MlaA
MTTPMRSGLMRTRGPVGLPACLLALLLLCAPAAAEPAAADSAANDLLNGYNRIIFAINHAVYSTLDSVMGWGHAAEPPKPDTAEPLKPDTAEPPAPSPAPGPGRVISNLVNEPLTALSSLVVGDLPTAWNAVQRFGINSTAGVLGWWDEASTLGYKPMPADIGLSLCRMGVGEGGYVVLPFIGPRTYRDAAVDVVLVNALLWTTTGAIFSSGLSLQTIVIAESIEVAADIVATRQIDPRAKDLRFDDYDKMRGDYLAQRRQRCAADSAMEVAAAP